jgi:cytochrome P450
VVAGHETTATTLSWAMYELHRHPEALASLRAALAPARALPPRPRPSRRCPCLEAACDETLRLHPPVPMVPRRLTRAFALGGYTLPAGTTLGVVSYMAHLREEVFAEAEVFKPERFVGRRYSPFEYYPWGGGARRCLGAAFAAYELRVALGTLLSTSAWVLDEPGPVRHAFRVGTYGPEGGIRMRPVV